MCINEKVISIEAKYMEEYNFIIISVSSIEILNAKSNFQCLTCSCNTYQRYDSNTHKTLQDVRSSSFSQSHENNIQKNILCSKKRNSVS